MSSRAADGTWIQTGAGPFDWGTAGNWSGGTVASGADSTASFAANITANQTINLDSARTIGNIVASDGSHNYTISGANILTLDRTTGIPYINVTPTGRALTISSVIDGADGLDKWGAGQLILNGSAVNTFTGGVKVSSGTLNLNFANLATPTNLVNSGNTLTLGGGNLLITGNSATNTNQTLGNVAVNAGGGTILVNPNGASRTATLNLGTITPAATGSLLVGKSSGSSGTAVITTTSGTLTNGIYGGNMVFFNGTAATGYDWATTATASPGPYTISGFSSYTTLPTSAGVATINYQMTASTTLTSGFSVNTLKMAPGATNSVALNLGGNTLTLEGGGLMFTGSGTGNRITTGTVTAGAGSGYKLFIHCFNSGYVNSGGSAGTSSPGVTAAIADNGANPVAVVVESTPGGTAGLVTISGTNTFTGGLYLNNASVFFNNTAAAVNNNTIYANGYSIISGMSLSNASPITLGDGAVLDIRLNTGTYTTSGAVTGKGGITLGQAGGGATNLNFNNTGNNFSGPIEYRVSPNSQNGTLSVNSIGDADVFGSGDIRFGLAGPGGTQVNTHSFSIGSGAIAPITFNNRRIELAGTFNALPVINNNSGQAFTINTDLVFSGGSSKLLNLGGSGAGVSTFAGDIGDSPNPTTGSTIVAAAYSTGATVITLGSVNGITAGAAITGPNIPGGTTVTAINPVTKQVTLSAATTGAGSVGTAVTATGVIGNLSLTKTGASIWTLSGNNSYSGGMTLNGTTAGSQLNINSATALGTGALTISGGDNAKIDNTSGNPITLTTDNAQVWSNNFAFVGSNSLNMGTGAVTMPGNRTITVTANTLTVGGIGETGGARNLTKSGVGTLVISGNSTYTGTTTVSAGTLQIGNGGATGSIAGTSSVTNNASIVYNRNNALTVGYAIGGTGSLTQAGTGTTTLTNTNGYSGATTVSAGTLVAGGTGSINSTSGISVAAGARFAYNSSTPLTVAPTLNGAGLGSRAIYGGTGTLAAALTLDNIGDTLSPGNSPGVQSYDVSQPWNTFSYDWELNDWVANTPGTNIDQIQINGGLDLTGTAYQLNVLSLTSGNVTGPVNAFTDTINSWTILSTTTGISNFDALEWTINTTDFDTQNPSATGTWSLSLTNGGNDLLLSYVVVPEPATMALAVVGLIGGYAALRRRRRVN